MPTVTKNELLVAFKLEGSVTVYWNKRSNCYHTCFRIGGKQHNRSCGTDNLANAKAKAAAIFAETVTRPAATAERTAMDKLTQQIAGLEAAVLKQTRSESQPLQTQSTSKHELSAAHDRFLASQQGIVGPEQLTGLRNRGRDFIRFVTEKGVIHVEDVTRDLGQEWGKHDERGVLHCRLQYEPPGVEDHGKRLARPLRVPAGA